MSDLKIDPNNIFGYLDTSRPVEAFENAILKGLKNPHDYMYMFSDCKYDYFKHKVTRQYREFKRKDNLFYKVLRYLRGIIK